MRITVRNSKIITWGFKVIHKNGNILILSPNLRLLRVIAIIWE